LSFLQVLDGVLGFLAEKKVKTKASAKVESTNFKKRSMDLLDFDAQDGYRFMTTNLAITCPKLPAIAKGKE
jgi:hypothetical protein